MTTRNLPVFDPWELARVCAVLTDREVGEFELTVVAMDACCVKVRYSTDPRAEDETIPWMADDAREALERLHDADPTLYPWSYGSPEAPRWHCKACLGLARADGRTCFACGGHAAAEAPTSIADVVSVAAIGAHTLATALERVNELAGERYDAVWSLLPYGSHVKPAGVGIETGDPPKFSGVYCQSFISRCAFLSVVRFPFPSDLS